ncbi:uncharacterized protein N0V89_000817 [Didymosphaeria variabile]|uniref:Uncharacterized protein n=1 Tax=Didymosphaeria variabile TaxID=1932322 RepID=A0A9W9CG40_9PLEO|nr:uncharacterized protein N0V89_000817 [Didymosphaeria variabile]KAJ4360257.1 hypothetical protein N0V89_000817 [Didymosphaeria variabile]
MTDTPSPKAKRKARADDNGAASSSTSFEPPRTPPRRSTQSASFTTPSSSALPSSLSSQRKSQARITSFFPNKKRRIETIPFELSPAEKKAKKQEEDDIKALIKDIENEERETKKAEKEAERQLKREEKLAVTREKKQKAQYRLNWNTWCERNARPNATFKTPKGDVWASHKCMSQCVQDFGLKRSEVLCLEHCSIPNYHNEDAPAIRLYRSDDVEKLVGRKEATLAGIEGIDEEDLIAEGRALFIEKQLARSANEKASATQL